MLARGKFGIEYNPKPLDEESSGIGWVVVAVLAVAAVSLACTVFSRLRSKSPEDEVVAPPKVAAAAVPVAPQELRSSMASRIAISMIPIDFFAFMFLPLFFFFIALKSF